MNIAPFGDPLCVVVARQQVVAHDTQSILSVLRRLLRYPAVARAHMEKVDISFDGYNDTPQELYEIPEVREYVHALDLEFPYWLFTPPLYPLLLETFQNARPGQEFVIGSAIHPHNVHRDIQVLWKKASVVPWKKPLHTLRKTCLTRWAREYPQHVVKEWAGHASVETTAQFYLKVGEGDYERAAGLTHREVPTATASPPPS